MTHTVWRDTASSACLGAASAETRFAWQILFVQQGFVFKIHFIFWEERKNHLQFASMTTVEVLYAETFSEWLSAVWGCSSVWGRNLSSPNYHQLHACMDGKEKKKTVNGNWYTNAWIAWLLCSGRCILHVSWALCSEHFSVRNSYVEEGYFFLFSLSDLLLPVNSCECVAQDFLSICKSKKFFFSPFFLLSLLPILSHFVKEWEWENGRWKNLLCSWS